MSEEEQGLRQRYKDDLPFYAGECLKIRPKSGELRPFLFNGVQTYVHGQLEAQRKATGKVRALILKARQEGVSTLIGARYYHQATHRKGCQVFILTHEQDATNNLFGMVERFQKHAPAGMAPRVGASNAKELYFPGLDSGYSVGTAGSKAVGRSKTIQLFHGSEVAFWPNAKDHFAGVAQTVPDLENTELILESTANGIGGEFHERWQQAEVGDGDFQAIFVPWFWSLDYQRPPPIDFQINEEEEDYARLYGLSVQQMVWRRAKLAELGDPSLFRQEYPATAAEAFQATGHDAFIPSMLLLGSARKRACEAIGSLVIGVDPARFGDDSFAIAWRRGRKVEKVERRYKLDVVQGANWVKQIIEQDSWPAEGVRGPWGTWARAWSICCCATGAGSTSGLWKGSTSEGAPQKSASGHRQGARLVPGPHNRRAGKCGCGRRRGCRGRRRGRYSRQRQPAGPDGVAPGYRYDARQFLVLEGKEERSGSGGCARRMDGTPWR